MVRAAHSLGRPGAHASRRPTRHLLPAAGRRSKAPASAANIGKPVAGKTGTTQDNRDAWFVGYTPKLTAAVWMGYVGAPGAEVRFMDDVHGREVTGGSFPAEIWAKFMRAATEGVDAGSLQGRRARSRAASSTRSWSSPRRRRPSLIEHLHHRGRR